MRLRDTFPFAISGDGEKSRRRLKKVAETADEGMRHALSEGGQGRREREGLGDQLLVILLEPDYWRRRGLTAVLEETEGIEVAGDHEDRADIVLLAHRLLTERGPSCIAALHKRWRAPVLVCGDDRRLTAAADAFAAGAGGYFDLGSATELLPKAMATVIAGRIWGPREALLLFAQRAKGAAETLESSQEELLRLLHDGLSNKEIGHRLGLAEATIKARMNRLYRRFGVKTRLQLLAAAIRRGAIEVLRDR